MMSHDSSFTKTHIQAGLGALLRNGQGKTDSQSDAIFSWLADEAKRRGLPYQKILILIMDGQESL